MKVKFKLSVWWSALLQTLRTPVIYYSEEESAICKISQSIQQVSFIVDKKSLKYMYNAADLEEGINDFLTI
jgi:hypothetical protein